MNREPIDHLALLLYALLIIAGLMALARSCDLDADAAFADEPVEICGNNTPSTP